MHIREVYRQVCAEKGVEIIKGVLSSDHVHMLVSVPPKPAISDSVGKKNGRSSRKIHQEFPKIRKRYWRQRFWDRGCLSTTSGNTAQDLVLEYFEQHISDPTGARR
ncbi:MAG: IS200/IS605 family transposase [Pseudomonadota bacterium]